MIYLDYQATTLLAPEARAAMLPWLGGPGELGFGNPHSPYRMGREAKAAVELAREQVIEALVSGAPNYPDFPKHLQNEWRNADGIENQLAALERYRAAERASGRLFFTSGATEAANWAIKGSWARRPQGRSRIVTVATEHACVLDTIVSLRGAGADIVILPVDRAGRVDCDAAAAAIGPSTLLVAAMLVNNEIGTRQDIAAIGARAKAAGALMFCDAVQGFGRASLPLSFCDLVVVSAHKVHGPKGIGALWVRNGCEPEPLLHGGGQEGGIRSGTLSPSLCAGFGAAAKLLLERERIDRLHVYKLFRKARKAFGSAWDLNGSIKAHYDGNLNVRLSGLDVARLMSELRDVAFSAGSACASGSGRPSHVLKAIGLSDAEARSSIRLGFGRYTSAEEIDSAVAAIREAAERQRIWA